MQVRPSFVPISYDINPSEIFFINVKAIFRSMLTSNKILYRKEVRQIMIKFII